MKKVISFVAFAALFAVIGVFAFMSAPVGSDFAAGEQVSESASAPSYEVTESNANAPTAASWNMIAMPLDSSGNFAAQGFSFDAAGLADYLGGSSVVSTILHWNPASGANGAFDPYVVSSGGGVNFPLETAGSYFIFVSSTTMDVATFVGDVPAQGSIHHNLVGAAACKWNNISIPLDQAATDAAGFGTALGGSSEVSTILSWNAGSQAFDPYIVSSGGGVNFPVNPGYPYMVCMLNNAMWP